MVQRLRVKIRLNSLWKRSTLCTKNKFFKITSRFSKGSRRLTWRTSTNSCSTKLSTTLKTKISFKILILSRISTRTLLAQNNSWSSTSSRPRSTSLAKRPITCAFRRSRPSRASNHRRWKASWRAPSNPQCRWTRTARRWLLLPLCLSRRRNQVRTRHCRRAESTTHKSPPN